MKDNKIQIPNTNDGMYASRLIELLEDKRKGDWLLVAEIVGISPKNAELSFNRVFSKNHNQVVAALEKVIGLRKSMLQNSK